LNACYAIGCYAIKTIHLKYRDLLLDEDVKNALKQAYIEVEDETLRNLGDRDLLILASLIKNQLPTRRTQRYLTAITLFSKE
jgi:hypothetical protein